MGYARRLRPRGGEVAQLAANALNRNFSTAAPNEAWLIDITYARTHAD